MALVGGGLYSHGTAPNAWAKAAQPQVEHQRVIPRRTVKTRMKGTVTRPEQKLIVYTPHSTRPMHPGALFYLSWRYPGNIPPNKFHVWVKKGRSTWSIDLGTNHNYFVAINAYQRKWRSPNPFPAGTDYYIKVRNTATGETSNSGFFTITAR